MLTTTKQIINRAAEGGYAVAAPNVSSELDARAYIEVAEDLNAPIILDVAFDAHPDIAFFGMVLRTLAEKSSVPVAIQLDHGSTRENIIKAIQAGFTAVMVDRSSLPFNQNVLEVKDIVGIAHSCGVSVEAELGHVGLANQYNIDRDAALTSVEEARKYIEETGVDCLAIAIGTSHGAYPKEFKPYLDFSRLIEINNAVNNFPLVLHGSSGTDNELLEKACKLGINKVNISNDLCRAAVDAIKSTNLLGNAAYDVWSCGINGAKIKLAEMIKIYGSYDKNWIHEYPGLPRSKTTLNESK